MSVQLEIWQLILLLIAFFGAVGAGTKVVLRMIEQRFLIQEAARTEGAAVWKDQFAALRDANSREAEEWARQFAALREESREEKANWRRIENDFLKFQATLPERFVMRDDYIRGQSLIEAKLDALASKLELIQIKGTKP